MDEWLNISTSGVLIHPSDAALEHCRRELVLDGWIQIDLQPLRRARILFGQRRAKAQRAVRRHMNIVCTTLKTNGGAMPIRCLLYTSDAADE